MVLPRVSDGGSLPRFRAMTPRYVGVQVQNRDFVPLFEHASLRAAPYSPHDPSSESPDLSWSASIESNL
jgi:hypothetical protein